MTAVLNLDFAILNFIQAHMKNGFFDAVLPVLSSLVDHGIIWIILAVILVCFKKTRKTGLMMAVALTLGLLLVNGIIKPIVGRPRPYTFDNALIKEGDLLVKALQDGSFPSGHTLASFEASTVLMIRDKRFGIPALVFSIIVLFSRLYLYVHFPTDVITGAILGVIFGVLGVVIVNFIDKKIKEKKLSK